MGRRKKSTPQKTLRIIRAGIGTSKMLLVETKTYENTLWYWENEDKTATLLDTRKSPYVRYDFSSLDELHKVAIEDLGKKGLKGEKVPRPKRRTVAEVVEETEEERGEDNNERDE